jgi:hypothetical protein
MTRVHFRFSRVTRAHAAQSGVTLGLEQGDLEADFSHLGAWDVNCDPPLLNFTGQESQYEES